FTAVSVMAIMYAHFHQPPPPITNVRPDVPADLAAAVMRMLEKEPEQRWPNMEAAVAAVSGAPLAPGDPIHVQLVTLASAGRSAQLRRRISTPLSPTPIGRGVGKTTNVAALSIKPGDVTIAVGGAVQLTVTAKRRCGSSPGPQALRSRHHVSCASSQRAPRSRYRRPSRPRRHRRPRRAGPRL